MRRHPWSVGSGWMMVAAVVCGMTALVLLLSLRAIYVLVELVLGGDVAADIAWSVEGWLGVPQLGWVVALAAVTGAMVWLARRQRRRELA